MDYERLTAPCGLDCFNCPLYRANEDEALREKVASGLGIAVEEAKCPGCRDAGGTVTCLGMTGPCQVFCCISEKGLRFCFECPEFPCDNLHPYADRASEVPHNTKVFNLCLIKKMGLENWAQNKARSVKRSYFKGKFTL